MSNNELTKDTLIKVLPKGMRSSINDELLDEVNSIIGNDVITENFRDNLLGFTNVLKDGKFKLADYINAVKFVSFKLLGSTNISSYTKTFPDRYQKFIDEGVSDKDISSYVSAYGKNKLVNLIMAQTMVPVHVYNLDIYQRAINTQAELMATAKSEKVRCDAANSLLTQLKPPEVNKIELDIGVGSNKAIEELLNTTAELTRQQKYMLESKVSSVSDIANSKLVIEDAEYSEVN